MWQTLGPDNIYQDYYSGVGKPPLNYIIQNFLDIPLSFLRGLDCILSQFRLPRPSLLTDDRAVVEGVPYPSYFNPRGGLRYFTRGLPMLRPPRRGYYYPKRSYDALGRYPGYHLEFPPSES